VDAGGGGLAYRLVEVDFRDGGTRTAAFLELNPNGHIPVLTDRELVLFESLAINEHLACRYAHALWPTEADDQSRARMWTAWILCELEGPHDAANRADRALADDVAPRIAATLEQALEQRDWLAGERFSVADLNVASVLMRPRVPCDVFAPASAAAQWFMRCREREALAKALATR
jgi:glutathione S-transferase